MADTSSSSAHAPVRAVSGIMPPAIPVRGVRIAGTGSQLPSKVISNDLLASVVQTNDEWIQQRTGIRERRMCDRSKGESNRWLCTESLRKALAAANMKASELDLIICGTISQDMRCPSTACLVAADLGAGTAAAWDLGAACCGFVYPLNVAHDLIRVGTHKAIGIIGCDTITAILDYHNRGVCILFGDGAGAAVLVADSDPSRGCLAQVNKADGTGWTDLFQPAEEWQIPEGVDRTTTKLGCLQMNGKAVFKFAVGTFQELIAETLAKAGISAEQVDVFVCHQSNARILDAARERFGIPPEKLHVNIDRVGNTSAGSVPLVLDELMLAGKIKPGMIVMFVAFGAGLTWTSSLWRV